MHEIHQETTATQWQAPLAKLPRAERHPPLRGKHLSHMRAIK